MRPHLRRHLFARRLEPDPAGEVMGDGHDHGDPDQRGEQPSLDELPEWQHEDIEGRVALEDGIELTERDVARGSPQQEGLPLAGGGDPDEDRDQGRKAQDDPPRIGFERGPVPLHQLLLLGEGAEARGEPPHDDQVRQQDREEQRPEHGAQQDLRPEYAPEDPGEMDLAEPQEIDVEAGEGRKDDGQYHDSGDRQDQPATARSGHDLSHALPHSLG